MALRIRSPGMTVEWYTRRRRRVYHSTVIPGDRMRNAIHLDAVSQSLHVGDNVEAAAERGQPIFKLTEAVHTDVDAGSIHFHTVAMEADATDVKRVGMSAMEELHSAAHFTPNVGSPAHRRCVELDPLHRQVGGIR